MSSSSSDEDRDRLREAVDPQFVVKKEKYRIKTSIDTCRSHNAEPIDSTSNGIRKKCSVRSSLKDEEDWNHLGTTPGFRDHVARHLSKFLDKQIKEIDSSDRLTQVTGQDGGGILLFTSSSAECLTSDEAKSTKKKLKSKRQAPSESSSSEDESKFKLVAVSGDWVLKKKGVYTDNNPQPADVIVTEKKPKVHKRQKN